MFITKFKLILFLLFLNKFLLVSGLLHENGALEASAVDDQLEKRNDLRAAKKSPIDFKDKPTYDQTLSYLTYLKEKYPKQVDVIKHHEKTNHSRELKAVHVKKLLEFGEKYTPRPIILLVSTMRGSYNNALLGALNILHKLLEHESEYGYPLDKYEFVIFPLVNPDGYEYSRTENTDWIANRHSWDYSDEDGSICIGTLPERNFPYKWKHTLYQDCIKTHEMGGKGGFSDAEARAVRTVIEKFELRTIIYISLYGDRQTIEYPWTFTRENHPDSPRLRYIAEAGAKAIKERTGRGTKMVVQQASFRNIQGGTDIDYVVHDKDVPNAFRMGIPKYSLNDMDEKNDTIHAIMDEVLVGILDMGHEALLHKKAIGPGSSGCRNYGTYIQIVTVILFHLF